MSHQSLNVCEGESRPSLQTEREGGEEGEERERKGRVFRSEEER